MGTKGSYSGGGGRLGDDIRDDLNDWLESLPGATSQPPSMDELDPSDAPRTPNFSAEARRVLPTVGLFSPRSASAGSGRNRESAALTRSATASAQSAGRGAAAAYAYRTGNAQLLRDLGLDYDALRANPNIFDVAHQIAQKVCEDLPEGTIETSEQLQVVGNLAEWILDSELAGVDISVGQIAEEAVALILSEAYLVTTASALNSKNLSGTERADFEDGVRQAAEELAASARLTPTGPTAAEFTSAIERGLEYLRSVFEV